MIHNFIRLNQGFEDEFDALEIDNEEEDEEQQFEENEMAANTLGDDIAESMWAEYQNYLAQNV